jgi:glycosyltransferase involved in cell wall biosynthesis
MKKLDRLCGDDRPKLWSIIIPTRQEARYIGCTLDAFQAARARDGLPVELVVVDGDSTDGTSAIARRRADRLVIRESTRAKGGIASARNAGADSASGDILFHTDADVIVPDLRSLMERASAEFLDPAIVGISVQLMPYPWNSTRRDYVAHRLLNLHFRMSYHYGAYFARGECQIVRRDAFDAVGGYREDLVSGEDCDLYQRMARIGRIKFLKDQVVYHSTRRFDRLGYVRTCAVYVREAIWRAIFGRSFAKEWKVIR